MKHSYAILCCVLLISTLGWFSCWRPPRSIPVPRPPYEFFFDGYVSGRPIWMGYSLDSAHWAQNQYRWLYQATVRGNSEQWMGMMGIEPQRRFDVELPSILLGLEGWTKDALNADANEDFFSRISTGTLEAGESDIRPAIYWKDSTGSYSTELSTIGQEPYCKIQIDSVHKNEFNSTPYLVLQGHIDAQLLHSTLHSPKAVHGRFKFHFFHPRATPRIFD